MRTLATIVLAVLGIGLVLSFQVFGVLLGVALILTAVWVRTGTVR
jgi:hypothetical protein